MNSNKLNNDNRKKLKFFKAADIIVYGIILAVTIIILCVFLIPKEKGQLEYLEIYKNDVLIYKYDFIGGEGKKITDVDDIKTEEFDENGITFVKIDEGGDYNIIEIGKDYALVSDANCSHYAPCEHYAAIKKDGDTIICLPHKLKLIGIGKGSNEVRL